MILNSESNQAKQIYSAVSKTSEKVKFHDVKGERVTKPTPIPVPSIALPGTKIDSEETRSKRLKNTRLESEIGLRKKLVSWVCRILLGQTCIADVLVAAYIFLTILYLHQSVPPVVVSVWISGTIIQMIAILAIITHGLFDRENQQ